MFSFLQKKPSISIVVISYNQKEYISECLDSILNQDIDKEIICVDDCSKDGTYELLCEYAEKHNEIKVYQNEKNMGVVHTRYNGLIHCRGKYMMFIDGDDKYLTNALKKLYEEAVNQSVDILEFGIETDGTDKLKKSFKCSKKIIKSDLLEAYKERKILNVLVNKLFSEKVYTKVIKKACPEYEHNNFSEVIYFMIHFLQNAKTFASTETVGYIYYDNRGMTAKLRGVELLKQYCGFATTKNELIQTYGFMDALNEKWNYVCNQAVVALLELSPQEQEENKYLLYELMSEEEAEFLIEGQKRMKNSI